MGCGASTAAPTVQLDPLNATTQSLNATTQSLKNAAALESRESFFETARELKEESRKKYPDGRHLLVIFNPMSTYK